MSTHKSWAPLWSTIVDSSIWEEPDHVFRLFMAMMALKDSDHVVRLTAYQLAKRTHRSEVEILDALRILSSPDERRLEKQEFEGRRVQSVEEGWLVLNGPKYRDMVQLELKRARNRRAQQAFRERAKGKTSQISKGTPLAGETAAIKAWAQGKTDDNFEPVKPTEQEKQDAKTFKRIHMENSGPNQQFPEI